MPMNSGATASASKTRMPLPEAQGTASITHLARTSDRPSTFAAAYFRRLCAILAQIDVGQVERLADELVRARAERSGIFIVGNGGSAATSSAMANDLGFDVLKRAGEANAFRVMALSDSSPLITAIANDVGYDEVFVSQLRILYRPGDRLLALSASGNSRNVVRAAEWVKAAGGRVIGLVGFSGGTLGTLSDVLVHVPSLDGEYGPVEDAHSAIAHVLAHWFQASRTSP